MWHTSLSLINFY